LREWLWKIGFTSWASRHVRRNWQQFCSGAISYLWVPSLETASSGAHTQFTFQKYPCLGPQMTPSATLLYLNYCTPIRSIYTFYTELSLCTLHYTVLSHYTLLYFYYCTPIRSIYTLHWTLTLHYTLHSTFLYLYYHPHSSPSHPTCWASLNPAASTCLAKYSNRRGWSLSSSSETSCTLPGVLGRDPAGTCTKGGFLECATNQLLTSSSGYLKEAFIWECWVKTLRHTYKGWFI